MKFRRSFRQIGHRIEKSAGLSSRRDRAVLRNIGLVSAGITALALGVVVGRELRQRYKFSRRTPYDAFAHAGDQVHDVECGVGI
ncbi:MAG: hypothetical protein V4555_17095 [Acidobacteriota bacterium]